MNERKQLLVQFHRNHWQIYYYNVQERVVVDRVDNRQQLETKLLQYESKGFSFTFVRRDCMAKPIISTGYWGRHLTSSDADTFPSMIKACKQCKVTLEYHTDKIGGRFFRISENDLDYLPRDSRGFYLPYDSESGYTIYQINVDDEFFPKANSKGWRQEF